MKGARILPPISKDTLTLDVSYSRAMWPIAAVWTSNRTLSIEQPLHYTLPTPTTATKIGSSGDVIHGEKHRITSLG